MSSPSKDRILIKGLGFHFEGEGSAAPLVAWISVSVLTLTIVMAVLFPALAGKVLGRPVAAAVSALQAVPKISAAYPKAPALN
jgi:hypothetical protein